MVTKLGTTPFAIPMRVVAMCFTALVALGACARRTEVVAVIDSDISYGSGQPLAGLLVTVRSGGPDGIVRDRRAIPIGSNEHGRFSLPASFGIVPLDNDATRTVFIQVDGCGGAGCDTTATPDAIVTQRAIVGFVRGQTLALQMFLADGCRGVVCPTTQTCSPTTHQCVDAHVPTSALTPFDPDAGRDARSDLGVDATDATDVPVVPPGSVTQFALGYAHACALLGDHTVRCWGANDSEQIGLRPGDPTAFALTARPVVGLSDVSQISAGGDTSCALLSTGEVRCWGQNYADQAGIAGSGSPITTPTSNGILNATAIATGSNHSCAVLADHTVSCWGANDSGQLGDGNTAASRIPGSVLGLANVTQVSLGEAHSCAVLADHTVRCWGANDRGQLGDGTLNDRPSPTLVVGVNDALEVRAGFTHTCVRSLSNTVRCWGDGGRSQLGNGAASMSTTPVDVMGLGAVSALAVGEDSACAIETTGGVKCWGTNFAGQRGTGNTNVDSSATPATLVPHDAVAVGVGRAFACAIVPNGSMVCWGENYSGQLGNGMSTSFTPSPHDIAMGTIVPTRIAVGLSPDSPAAIWDPTSHSCEAWGENFDGYPFTAGSGLATSAPAAGPLANVTDVSMGFRFMCAATSDGLAHCWGRDDHGVWGDGTLGASGATISTVHTITGTTHVSAGGSHVCAQDGTGQSWCWGSNESGELGTRTSSMTPSTEPQSVTIVTGPIAEIDAGDGWTCARPTSGAVQCWGSNFYNRLAPSGPDIVSTPVTITGTAAATALSVGGNHACVLASGQVLCWGENEAFQLGVPTASPGVALAVTLPTGFSPVQVVAGSLVSCARGMDGTVACWGDNDTGQLGTGSYTPVYQMTPQRVTGLSDAIDISVGRDVACALHRSGRATCWGTVPGSGLGDGQSTGQYMPTPVMFP